MALIEIDGLPINSMVIFHGYVSHNQMVPHGTRQVTVTLWSVIWLEDQSMRFP